jgi:hypothetical protein
MYMCVDMQQRRRRQAAMTGDLVGKRVLLVQTGKDDIDGTYGKALKWDSDVKDHFFQENKPIFLSTGPPLCCLFY